MTHRRALVGCGALALLVLFVVIKLAPGRGGGDGTRITGGCSDAPVGPFAGYTWSGNVQSVGGVVHGTADYR
jgi:hypothetical protein